MRVSLTVSLLFHLVLFFTIQKTFSLNWLSEPLRTYRVELLRPSMDAVDIEEEGGADLAGIEPAEETRSPQTEDTISLDTKDKRYSSYANVIKKKLMDHWYYPWEARENLIEGKVLVLFSLGRNGRLRLIKILQTSTHEILDAETSRAIRAAAPFPPFPGSIPVSLLHIKADFAYRLALPR